MQAIKNALNESAYQGTAAELYNNIISTSLLPYQRHVADIDSIPASLHDKPIWCAWKLTPPKKEGAKPGKVPISPLDGSQNWRNRETPFCTDLATTIDYVNRKTRLHGIGVILSPEHGISGGDLDGCRDKDTGVVSDEAMEIINEANTYTEVSTGTEGFRFLFEGSFGGFTCNNQAKGVELYEDKRFLTITGDHVTGTPFSIEKRDLTALGKRFSVKEKPTKSDVNNKLDFSVEVPVSDNDNVSIDEFMIPAHVREWIIEGTPEGTRSDRIFQAAKDLIREGATPEQTLDILSDPVHRISDAGMDRRGHIGSAREWIWKYAVQPAQRDIALETKAPAFDVIVSRHAEKIAKYIEKDLTRRLKLSEPEQIQKLKINAVNIDRMIKGSFWSGSSSKLFLLNHDDALNRYKEADASKYLAMTFGSIVDNDYISAAAMAVATGTEAQVAKFIAQAKAVAPTAVLDHIKFYNQRDSIEWRVDMFIKHSRVELTEETARIVIPHRPFESINASKEIDWYVVEDYKQHFTRFDEVLFFLVAARFATDRKKAYLWIKADSDWGKGFFTDLLGYIGTTVELSVREVEKMFDGNPVGRSPQEFKRAFAIVFNEFKSVKSELKQLESGLALSPKHQLVSRVEVFAKLLFSAEGVQSLANENGVEDQFANRISIFEEKGDIEERALWQKVGKRYYFSNVLAYTIQRLNALVDQMVAMGKDKAGDYADKHLDEFIGKYGLDTMFQRYSETLPELADDIIRWAINTSDCFDSRKPDVVQSGIDYYLRSPMKVIDDYIDIHFDQSVRPSIRKKKDSIALLMSGDEIAVKDNKPIKAYRVADLRNPIKAIKLKNL